MEVAADGSWDPRAMAGKAKENPGREEKARARTTQTRTLTEIQARMQVLLRLSSTGFVHTVTHGCTSAPIAAGTVAGVEEQHTSIAVSGRADDMACESDDHGDASWSACYVGQPSQQEHCWWVWEAARCARE